MINASTISTKIESIVINFLLYTVRIISFFFIFNRTLTRFELGFDWFLVILGVVG